MPKKIISNAQAKEAIKRGIDTLADVVKVTLGPKGQNVVLERLYTQHTITKDGVTVAREISLEDPFEDIGAQLVKAVASKTAEDAGDGTTTATVLAQSIFTHGMKNVAAGANPMDLKKGIDKAVLAVVEDLKSQSKVIANNQEIAQIATISANNDTEIGNMIAGAMAKVGKDGIIVIEDGLTTETEVKIVEGLRFDRGYIAPPFVTDPVKMEAVLENALILLYDRKISTMRSFLPVLEQAAKTGRPLLVIAEDVDGEAIATLIVNKVRNGLRVCVVRAPEFGTKRKDIMSDIAILTKGQIISEDAGLKLENATAAMFGQAEKIVVTATNTTIINGAGDKAKITERIDQIKSQMETAEHHEKEVMQKRIARLSGGVAIMYVGGYTEIEMKEKKDRIDDAVHATRAAVQEGILPGGGVAYIRAIECLKLIAGHNEDEYTGINIIRQALESPLRTIVENAGKEGSVILNKIQEGNGDYGYNARNDRYERLFETGIIDPTKVTRLALENAASIAGLLLTTRSIVTEIRKDDARKGTFQQA